MKQIPTAEEFFEQGGTYPELAIEFAKLHVKAALKSVLINVDIDMNGISKNQLPNPHFKIIENSILNAYPLTNIK